MHTGKCYNLEILWQNAEYEKLLGPLLEQAIANLTTYPSKNSPYEGRGPFSLIQTSPQQIFRIRPYLRGGWIRHLNRDLFWGSKRPYQEFRISLQAYKSGIPTAEPIAGVVRKSPMGLGLYRGYWVSREISNTKNLFHFLKSNPTFKKKRESLSQVALAVRKMHDIGIFHADLHLGNVLIQEDGDPLPIYLIDFDRARIQSPLSEKDRKANLIRFYRSAYKYPTIRTHFSAEDWKFFFQSYGLEPAAMKNVIKEGEQSVRKHALSWRFQRGAGSQ